MRTHPLNVSYLVVGLVFLGLSGSCPARVRSCRPRDAGWLLPATLVVAGVIGLVAFAAKGVTGRNRADDDMS